MQVQELAIADVKVLTPGKHGDRRGFFSEVYNKGTLAKTGIDTDFVQDNHSWSALKWTVHGLHFQTPPRVQDKLVRMVRGSIFDVAGRNEILDAEELRLLWRQVLDQRCVADLAGPWPGTIISGVEGCYRGELPTDLVLRAVVMRADRSVVGDFGPLDAFDEKLLEDL